MKTVLQVILVMALVGLPIALRALSMGTPVAAEGASSAREVETRFAIRYCSSQYRSQIDLDHCLAKLLPASAPSA